MVPLVERLVGVDALVALQPDQLPVEHGGEHLRDLGLPDAGLALQQQGPVQREGHVDGSGQAAVGEVGALAQQSCQLRDAGAHAFDLGSCPARSSPMVVAPSLPSRASKSRHAKPLLVVDRPGTDVLEPATHLPGARSDLGQHVRTVLTPRGPDGAQHGHTRLLIHGPIVLRAALSGNRRITVPLARLRVTML